MSLSASEILDINRRAMARLQDLTDDIREAGSGLARGSALQINPTSTERVIWFRPVSELTGAWADLGGGSASPDDRADLIGLVRHLAGGETTRAEAAIALRDWLDLLPPPAPTFADILASRRGQAVTAEPAPRHPSAQISHRSLRRG